MNEGGRPRKPRNLAVLEGYRKDRVNDREPVPGRGEVAPPFKLTKAAQEVWDRLAPDRQARGVLTAWDVDAFAEFCEAVVILRGKRKSARRKPEPGAPSPMSEYKAALAVVSALGSRFGWTPADRAKLVTEGERDGPKAERLLS